MLTKKFRCNVTDEFMRNGPFPTHESMIDLIMFDYPEKMIDPKWTIIDSSGQVIQNDFGIDVYFLRDLISRAISENVWIFEVIHK